MSLRENFGFYAGLGSGLVLSLLLSKLVDVYLKKYQDEDSEGIN